MVVNVRDARSGASVHPQYNILNVMYSMYVQVFKNIEEGNVSPDIKDYIERNSITSAQIVSQQALIADLLDGLLSGRFEREEGTPHVLQAMNDCDWYNRVNWSAMAVFDMLASRSMLGYWFNAAADLFNEEDIRAQSPGQLTEIINRMCEHAAKTGQSISTGK